MTAIELRIGNLIQWISTGNTDVVKDIVTLDKREANVNNVSISDCIGIELTRDWLLKFGFVYRGIYYHFPNNDIFKLEQYKNKNSFWLRHGSESIDCTRINHVHQLQNLYFALTSEELQLTNEEKTKWTI